MTDVETLTVAEVVEELRKPDLRGSTAGLRIIAASMLESQTARVEQLERELVEADRYQKYAARLEAERNEVREELNRAVWSAARYEAERDEARKELAATETRLIRALRGAA